MENFMNDDLSGDRLDDPEGIRRTIEEISRRTVEEVAREDHYLPSIWEPADCPLNGPAPCGMYGDGIGGGK